MPFQPFDLGQVLQTAEAIKGARRQSVTDQLQQQYLGQRIEAGKMEMDANQRAEQVVLGKDKAKQVYTISQYALQSEDPKSFIEQNAPELVQNLQKNGTDWATVDQPTVQRMLQGVMAKAGSELGIGPEGSAPAGVQSTFNGRNGNLWIVGRDGKLTDSGVPVQQYAQRPVEAAGGLYSYDPASGNLSGQIASPEAQRTAAAASAGGVQAAREEATTQAIPDQVGARTQSERLASYIDEGVRAADALPVINRALTLLDSVKTGGIDAAKLAATNLLGVTGADEAELSNNLGKAILSQLRSTFGAQFTEREGARLDALEANFGKSTEGNKRILQQVKQLVERSARRGIDSARRSGDDFAVSEIERAMNMDLTPQDSPPMSDQPQKVGEFTIRRIK